jgi:hypothetical protein
MKYTELQIIKHSLQYYITRSYVSDKEIEQEIRLLDKITAQVEEMKNKYEIK